MIGEERRGRRLEASDTKGDRRSWAMEMEFRTECCKVEIVISWIPSSNYPKITALSACSDGMS